MIHFIDREGYRVRLTKEDVKESLRQMGFRGDVVLCLPTEENEKLGDNIVVRIRCHKLPYNVWQKFKKWLKFTLAERRRLRAMRELYPEMIMKQKPFTLERPWLRLERAEQLKLKV